jgi:hypothetical protein
MSATKITSCHEGNLHQRRCCIFRAASIAPSELSLLQGILTVGVGDIIEVNDKMQTEIDCGGFAPPLPKILQQNQSP